MMEEKNKWTAGKTREGRTALPSIAPSRPQAGGVGGRREDLLPDHLGIRITTKNECSIFWTELVFDLNQPEGFYYQWMPTGEMDLLRLHVVTGKSGS